VFVVGTKEDESDQGFERSWSRMSRVLGESGVCRECIRCLAVAIEVDSEKWINCNENDFRFKIVFITKKEFQYKIENRNKNDDKARHDLLTWSICMLLSRSLSGTAARLAFTIVGNFRHRKITDKSEAQTQEISVGYT
jgi:hypothetical protein